MKTHISNQNSKIGKIPNFSLTPIKSCPNCKYCFQTEYKLQCYAVKAYKQYTNVKTAWDENLYLAENFPGVQCMDIVKYLDKTKKVFFRIHVSGDFFDQRYLNMWIWITKQFKHIKFLAFTKAFKLDYSNIPKNMKIIYSIMPNMPMPIKKGSRAYCGNIPKTNKHKVRSCPGNCESCGMCWNLENNESVHFPIH